MRFNKEPFFAHIKISGTLLEKEQESISLQKILSLKTDKTQFYLINLKRNLDKYAPSWPVIPNISAIFFFIFQIISIFIIRDYQIQKII